MIGFEEFFKYVVLGETSPCDDLFVSISTRKRAFVFGGMPELGGELRVTQAANIVVGFPIFPFPLSSIWGAVVYGYMVEAEDKKKEA